MASKNSEIGRNCGILCVGLLCLDHKYILLSFGNEGSESYSITYSRSRGGNASTNSVILAQLGLIQAEFFGSIGDNVDTKFCLSELTNFKVYVNNCVKHPTFVLPNTSALINKQKGTRTLLHYRGTFPELTYEDFSKLDLSRYKLIHFEGRPNIEELTRMLFHLKKWNEITSEKILISFEMEKARDFRDIYSQTDILFIGKDYATSLGFKDMQSTVLFQSEQIMHGSIVICAWGTKGACGIVKNQEKMEYSDIVLSKCFPPVGDVKDTLGAGDTFVAACLFSLLKSPRHQWNEKLLNKILQFGCKVAGYKCGIMGFELNQSILTKFKECLT